MRPSHTTSRLPLLLALMLPIVTGTVLAERFNDHEKLHAEHPEWFVEDPFLDLEAVLGEARDDGKLGLMVLYTTEGCSYCNVFIRRALGDEQIAARVRRHFASVGLEIFDDTGMTTPDGASLSVKQFADREQVGYSPSLLFYTGDHGGRSLRLVGYQSPERFQSVLDYLVSGAYQQQTLRDYLQLQARTAHPVAELPDDALFTSPPYALDRTGYPASRPLVVLFEIPGCSECEAFHREVLGNAEVREKLQGFEVVRLSAIDRETPVLTPDGRRTHPAQWFADADFSRAPALLFFDERGNEVLKTDALVMRGRMLNSINFVLDRAYEKNWTYQRYARSRAIARRLAGSGAN